jgi:tetracycline resistance efflux pump
MQPDWLVLLPPLIVLTCAFITRRVITSIFLGIISAAFILNNYDIPKLFSTIISRTWEKSELQTLTSWSAFNENWGLSICLFLLTLGIIIVLVNHSGGAYAYSSFIKKRLKSKKATQTASLTLSLFFFIDDYFSSLTVGSVMQPLTDKFKIARAKLAFLVDSMAAPLAILAPVSSWAAYVVIQLRKAGICKTTHPETYILADPFFVFTQTIPFIFYSLIIIASAWFIVRRQISIGLMNRHEKVAEKTDNLFCGKKPLTRKMRDVTKENIEQASVFDFLIPIITLIICVIIGLLYSGGFFIFGGKNNLLIALQNAKSQMALFWAGVITLVSTIIFYLIRKKIKPKEILSNLWEGAGLMFSTVIVLVLAWTFSGILDDLGTGPYIANLLIGHVAIKFLPLLFFAVTAITAGSMGSAWGAMAVIIPIAIPMLISFMQLQAPVMLQSLPIFFPMLGAILSGATSGNHMAPVSDTTIMSAKSSGAYHMDHVQTQYTYALPALFCTGLAFLVSGFMITYPTWINILTSVGSGIVVNFLYLTIRNRFKKKIL